MKRYEAIDTTNKIARILNASIADRVADADHADANGMIRDMLTARTALENLINKLVTEGIDD